MDNLTPLDARNSLLMDRPKTGATDSSTTFSMSNTVEKAPLARSESPERYLGHERNQLSVSGPNQLSSPYRPLTPGTPVNGNADLVREGLVRGAAPIGRSEPTRQPTLPNLGYGANPNAGGYGGYAQQPYGGGYGNGGYSSYDNGHYRSRSGDSDRY
jgi:hypothetical protein